MQTIPRIHIVTVVQPGADAPQVDEVQRVANYQEGWNDAQRGRPHKFNAPFHYSLGYVDGAEVIGGMQ